MPKEVGNDLAWKVHLPNLLEEIGANPGAWALNIPLLTLSRILEQLATRCSQINDPVLNGHMCMLTLYQIADPLQKDQFDSDRTQEMIADAVRWAREFRVEKKDG